VLDDFTTAGGNFIDTADVYSTWAEGHKGGESETVLGAWLKSRGNRDKVIVATKVGSDMGNGRKGLKAGYIAQAVEDSLKRLQTDYVDLYQSHRDDLDTPQEETLEAYAKLVKAGKVRAIGASNFTAERLSAALAISAKTGLPRYESLQPEYNLYERAGYEKELEPLCRKEQVGVIGYFGLASGFLTGKYRSEADLTKSPRGEDMGTYFNERGFGILKALDEVAAETKATPAQVAVAWLIARPGVTAPIVSATKVEQSQQLIKAMRLKLSPAQIEALNAASAY
jgi:aryl-alcohol dehydrogenase-like predicted oxidoreductase